MEWLAIAEPFEGVCRACIDGGGLPIWCMFDYAVSPAPGNDGVDVVLAEGADRESIRWFPHVKRGIEEARASWQDHGKALTRIEVVITKIPSHPVNTTVGACEVYGAIFVRTLLDRSTPVEARGGGLRGM